MRKGMVPALVLVVGFAGCVGTLGAGSEADHVRSTPADRFEFGASLTFRGDDPLAWVRFFNATQASVATYSFAIGDGGSARACFVTQRALVDHLEMTYAPISSKVYLTETTACSSGRAGEARATLDEGPWALALLSLGCPRLDRAMDVTEEVPDTGPGSSALIDVKARFGRADRVLIEDPAYPRDTAEDDRSPPVPTSSP